MPTSENKDLIPINITIADRTYRVKIATKDEETVRKTAALINQKMVEFKNAYAGKDMQDYISMVLLWYTTEQQANGQSLHEIEQLKNQLDNMGQAIEKILPNT